MLRNRQRFSTLLVVFALVAGNAALCEGWLASPAARMACCMAGATCPMHQSESKEFGASHHVSQADADGCCAGAEHRGSAPSPSTFTSGSPLAVVASPTPTVVPAQLHAVGRLPASGVPLTDTPRHLLLTVLQV